MSIVPLRNCYYGFLYSSDSLSLLSFFFSPGDGVLQTGALLTCAATGASCPINLAPRPYSPFSSLYHHFCSFYFNLTRFNLDSTALSFKVLFLVSARRVLHRRRRLYGELVPLRCAHVYGRQHAVYRRERHVRCFGGYEDFPVLPVPGYVRRLRRVGVTVTTLEYAVDCRLNCAILEIGQYNTIL